MSTLPELQEAVRRLSRSEMWRFKEWLEEYAADDWDREIEADAASGRLQAGFADLIAEAKRDVAAGRHYPTPDQVPEGVDPTRTAGNRPAGNEVAKEEAAA